MTSLGQAFVFNADDLAANRQGRLSADQATMFANVAAYGRRRSRIVLPIFGLLLLGTVALAIVTSGPDAGIGPFVVIGVMGGFMILLVAVFARRSSRDQAVKATGRVFAVAGTFTFDSSMDGNWFVEIGGARFPVDRLQLEALDEDASYRAYFLGTQPYQTLLSLEKA